jgi:hypothetical protein
VAALSRFAPASLYRLAGFTTGSMPGTVWIAEAGLVVEALDGDRVFKLPEPPPPQDARPTDTTAAAINAGNDDRGGPRRAASETAAPRSSVMDSPFR